MGIIKDWWRRRKNNSKSGGATAKKHKHNQVAPKVLDDLDRLHDVTTPLSIGIATAYDLTWVKIPRNTTIPTKQIETSVTTMYDNQKSVSLSFYQGERIRPADNRFLGKLVFTGIPPAPRCVPKIALSLHVDADNTLHVTAEDKATGYKEAISVKLGVIGMVNRREEEVVKKMVREAEKYKLEDEEYEKKMRVVQAMVEYACTMREKDGAVVGGGGEGEGEGECSKKLIPVVDKVTVDGVKDVVGGLLEEFRVNVKKLGSSTRDLNQPVEHINV